MLKPAISKETKQKKMRTLGFVWAFKKNTSFVGEKANRQREKGKSKKSLTMLYYA